MREILFRGKRSDNGEWIEGYYAMQSNHACFASALKYQYFIFKDVCMDFDLGGLQEFEVNPETVGQYTGLTDENGTKIFEGDIIRFERENLFGMTSRTGFIKWAEEWGMFYIHADTGDGWSITEVSNVEVIDNIHDNPKFLEGMK